MMKSCPVSCDAFCEIWTHCLLLYCILLFLLSALQRSLNARVTILLRVQVITAAPPLLADEKVSFGSWAVLYFSTLSTCHHFWWILSGFSLLCSSPTQFLFGYVSWTAYSREFLTSCAVTKGLLLTMQSSTSPVLLKHVGPDVFMVYMTFARH